MTPDERQTSEPEYSPTRDRRFSDLPSADRFDLIKEALHDLNLLYLGSQYYVPYVPYVPSSFLFVAGLGFGFFGLTMMDPKELHVTDSFALWGGCHLFLITALFVSSMVFGYMANKKTKEMLDLLEQIEEETVRSTHR